MDNIPTAIDSKFRYVLLVARRAEQLIQGALPRLETKDSKPTRIAAREVQAEKIEWEIPSGEE